MAREDGAVVLDAALALDHAGEQVAVDAQHRSHTGQQRNDDIHGYANIGAGELFHPVCCDGVDDRDQHTEYHSTQHAAYSALHRLFGADHRAELMLAKGAAREVGAGIAAPGEAEDEQDEEDGVVAIFLHRQHLLEPDERVEAEDHDARKHGEAAGFLVADDAVAHYKVDGIEQHHKEGSGHHHRPADAVARQHDEQCVGYQNGQQRPVLLFKTQRRVNFMQGDEGDSRDDQIEHQRIEGEQDACQNDQAHHGCDDSCFHSFMFSFVSSGSRSPALAGSAASAPEEIPDALRGPRTPRGILRIVCCAQSPPKRRERRLNSMMAASRSSRVKSGHRTSISTSSE